MLDRLNKAWEFCKENPGSQGGRKHYDQLMFQANDREIKEHLEWVHGQAETSEA